MNLTELLTTLEAPIVVRPTRRMTQGELESYLDKAADILRGNADHSEFRGYVFTLLFYKRINDLEATEEDAARTRELIRQHIDVEELEKEFFAYVLDEHFLTKLKDQKPDAKALDIEAMLTAELRIHLDQNESFQPLSEKLQRIIDEKRAGTLAGIALIEELESLTEAVRSAVEEAKRPIGQQLALKIKARNVALTEAQAAEVAASILEEADKHCFPGWWNVSSIDPELSKALLLLLAQRFSALGLLAGDTMEFIGQLVQVLKRMHYNPESKDA